MGHMFRILRTPTKILIFFSSYMFRISFFAHIWDIWSGFYTPLLKFRYFLAHIPMFRILHTPTKIPIFWWIIMNFGRFRWIPGGFLMSWSIFDVHHGTLYADEFPLSKSQSRHWPGLFRNRISRSWFLMDFQGFVWFFSGFRSWFFSGLSRSWLYAHSGTYVQDFTHPH